MDIHYVTLEHLNSTNRGLTTYGHPVIKKLHVFWGYFLELSMVLSVLLTCASTVCIILSAQLWTIYMWSHVNISKKTVTSKMCSLKIGSVHETHRDRKSVV